jgi:uncharacterized protein (TIGR03437 family)
MGKARRWITRFCFERIELAAGPPLVSAASTTLYAAFSATNANLLGIWRSTDGGVTWLKVTSPQLAGQAYYNLALAVDPIDANIVYYGTSANSVNTGGTLWRSRDGGQTWTDISGGNGSTGGLHADTHWIAISPTNRDVLFTANDGGVWRTSNATANVVAWTSLNQTLNVTQFQTIALHPSDPNILLGGTQDNDTNRYDGSPNWFQARGGDGGFALIDQANPQVLYHTFFNQDNADGQRAQIGPEISLNGGNSWARRGCFGCSAQVGNFNPADRVGFYAPMTLHPAFTGTSGNVVYFGTKRLYRTADQGVTWIGLGASADGFGADLTKNSSTTYSHISAITAHPALNQDGSPPGEVVWVGTNDGLVQLTTNAGALAAATFTNVTRAPLPNRFVTDIALDQNNQQRAFVTYSGFNTNTPDTPGHIFMTNDQGQAWLDISGNLPDVPVTSLVLDPLRSGVLYAGTDIDVFQTADQGVTWLRLGSNLPNVAVLMLRYHAATRALIAATHGGGVYRLALPRAVVSVSAASFSSAELASEAIIAAFGSALATTTEAAATVPLPTELAGTRLLVRDSQNVERAAPLFFVAPMQINYQLPSGTAQGWATVTAVSGDGAVSLGTVFVNSVAPSLFTANANGRDVAAGVAVRVRNGVQTIEALARFDATQNRFVPIPLELGPPEDVVVLVLFGTGFRHRSAQTDVRLSLGGAEAPVQFAAAAPGSVGLDQLNALVPRALAGRGEVEAVLTVAGRASNTVKLAFR